MSQTYNLPAPGQKYYASRDDLLDHCSIKVHTINRWISEFSPTIEESKTEKGNKKYYELGYLENLFEIKKESESFLKFRQSFFTKNTEAEECSSSDQAVLEHLEKFQETIDTQNESYSLLVKQLGKMTEMLENQQKLTNQANQLYFESRLEVKSLENKLKLLQNPPESKRWLFWRFWRSND